MYTRNVSPYDGGVFHQVRNQQLIALTMKVHCFSNVLICIGSTASSDIRIAAEFQRTPSTNRHFLLIDRPRKRERIGHHIRFGTSSLGETTFNIAKTHSI